MPVHKREYIVNWCMIFENVKVSFDLSEQIVSMVTVYRIDLMGIYFCFLDIIIMWLGIATFAETYITDSLCRCTFEKSSGAPCIVL